MGIWRIGKFCLFESLEPTPVYVGLKLHHSNNLNPGVAMIWQVLRSALVLMCLLIQAASAGAGQKTKPAKHLQSRPSMTFAVVRSSVPGCEPNCPQWIAAEGELKPGTGARFKQFLKKLGDQRLPVIITSPGGDVSSALAMGRMIRARKLDVAVGWTLYSGCGPTTKTCTLPKGQHGVYQGIAATGQGYCASACPFILAGGIRRLQGAGAYVGVHEISTQPFYERLRYYETYRIVNGKKKILSRKLLSRKKILGKVTTKLGKPFNIKLTSYLAEMGVDAKLLDLLHLAPPSSIHYMTFEEAKSTHLVTDFLPSAVLTQNSLCQKKPPAANCIVKKGPSVAASTTAN